MSIFNIDDARKDIFCMAQFAHATFHRDILYFLKMTCNVCATDDKLAQIVYLNRYPIMNPEEMDENELSRLQKINVKNLRALYASEIIQNLTFILNYFRYISDHDFRFIIPRKADLKFHEYLNIIAKYQIEHASEAFESFASSMRAPRLYDEYMFVSQSDIDILLNRFNKILSILVHKSKDPLANFFSFDSLKLQICKRLEILCRMTLPVKKDFEFFEEKEPILYKHVRAMNAPYFKIYNTSILNDKFTLNHAFLMGKPIDIANIGYTEDAALFLVLRDYIQNKINEIMIGEPKDVANKVQPDTCAVK